MKELMLTSNKETEIKIINVELVEIINEFRKLKPETIEKGYKKLKHDSFMAKTSKRVKTLKQFGNSFSPKYFGINLY